MFCIKYLAAYKPAINLEQFKKTDLSQCWMYIQYIQFQEIIHTVKFNSLESTLKVYFNVEESNQSVTI